MNALTVDEKLELIQLDAELERRRSRNKLASYRPYPKQREFHDAGGIPGILDRLLMAGNQQGKTVSAGAETAFHLTGLYPDDWKGKRFDHPTIGWAAGVTGESTRDNPQRILLGRVGYWGEGSIPGDLIIQTTRKSRGVTDSVDSVRVRHVSGAISTVLFKAYEQGRAKWQGETLDFVWFDEEPPEEIFTEGKARTQAGDGGKGGITYTTFTPLLGMSNVVKRFLIDKVPGSHVTHMTIEDAEHYTPAQREIIIAGYPEYEREARARGIPTMGSGRVFPVSEESIIVDAVEIEPHWPRICGIDFGWDHPTAAAWLAWDRDNDIVYLTHDYALSKATPIIHASNIRRHGSDIPVAWPHDGLQHDKGSGEQLAQQYRNEGLLMLPDRATFEDGTNGVEAGVMEMLDRMQTGRWKVVRSCGVWLNEFRLYHRENGLIVKMDDDCISASRYALMMLRHAKTGGPTKRPKLNFRSEFARA